MPAAYFLYARKSTDEDDKQIMSIDSQLHELREFARREGLVVVEGFVEAKTAKHPGRPVFNLMMEQVEAGKVDGLLAWHPDRLARNSVDGGRVIYLLDIGKLTDLRFPTYRFDNTAQGKFVLSIAFGQSKYYVDSLSENVKRGYREKLRRGGWPGLAPLGYLNDEINHTIVVDAERALLVKKLFEVYATGEYTLEELGREAGRWGLRSKSGKPVRKNVLAKILTNPFYYGVMRFNGQHHEGSHPPLLSKALFDRAQQALALRSKPRASGKIAFSFTGFLRCGECGCMVTAEIQKGHTYYHCTKQRGACSQRYLREEALLAQIQQALLKVSLDTETKDQILAHWTGQATQASNASLTRSRQIAERLKVCDEQMERLLDLYVAKEIDSEEYQRKKAKLLGEKQELKEALGEIERGRTSVCSAFCGRADCGHARSGGWLEPAKAFLTTCHEAGLVARHGAPRTHRQFLKTVGSNLMLSNRTLSLAYTSPYQLVAQHAEKRNWGPLSDSASNRGRLALSVTAQATYAGTTRWRRLASNRPT